MASASLFSAARTARIAPGAGAALGYSVGNLGKSIVWTSFETFLLYYLVRLVGVSPVVAGGLLSGIMLWDALADVAVAYLADRHGRSNALARLILLGAPLCGIGFWGIFALPLGSGFAAVAAAVIVCRCGYTLCDIGHNTLLVRIATTGARAATVSGLRLICSALGAGVVGLAASAILSAPVGEQHSAFALAAGCGGALYVITLLAAMYATREMRSGVAPRVEGSARRTSFALLWRNPAYRLVLALVAVQAGLVPLFNRALPFLGEAVHGGAGWGGTALLVITAAQALSLPGWMLLSRTRSSTALLALAYGAMIAALLVLTASSTGLSGAVGLALMGAAQAGMNLAIWAMLALAVRSGIATGAGNEALPVGVFLTVLKGSAGLGGGALALAVAAGERWCARCGDTGAAPVVLAATVLPLLGCGVALLMLVTTRRSMAKIATE